MKGLVSYGFDGLCYDKYANGLMVWIRIKVLREKS
ncbi:hypothetical protein PP657_gp031 [Bacillus phage BCPST]|uniref:Uncharacterized protein n=1 Tax=Bacillus phage BCPST TaxID=2801506 RepID=A0AAE7PD25_9CAUD|nr:hypothetical protein PP657_gp031 [Bacillus phage BCPST]QQO38649.1 hypothetical protein BCPST_031 [Bacillus phage BCPST]QSJ04240.1 hypothetical protein BCP6_035 [Bacillus phage BCP6]